MERVATILARKQPHFNIVSCDVSVSDALNRMNYENIDFLIVMDDEQFLGLLTEHDIASKAIMNFRPLDKILVTEMMNTQLPVISSQDTLERCMKLMRLFKVQHLPVFEDFQFYGIVSSDDILQEAIINRAGIFDGEMEEEIFSKVY